MAVRKCLNINQYSVVLDEMTKTVAKVVSKLDGINQVAALKQLRTYIHKEYNDLAYIVDDAIKKQYGYDILGNNLKFEKIKRKEAKLIIKLGAAYLPMDSMQGMMNDFQQNKIEVDPDDNILPDDFLPDFINGGININDGGVDNTLYMFHAALGVKLTPDSLINIDRKISKSKDFESFYNQLKDMDIYEGERKLPELDTENVGGKVRIRLLKPYYLARRDINRVPAERKNQSVITNLDPSKIAGITSMINTLKKEGIRGRNLLEEIQLLFLDAIVSGTKYTIPRLPISLHNKRLLPLYEAASSIEALALDNITYRINIKDFVKIQTNAASAGRSGAPIHWWSVPDHYNFSEEMLHALEFGQAMINRRALLGMVAGTNGNILFSTITDDHINQIFSGDIVKALMKFAEYPKPFYDKAAKKIDSGKATAADIVLALKEQSDKYLSAQVNRQLGKFTEKQQSDMAAAHVNYKVLERGLTVVAEKQLIDILEKENAEYEERTGRELYTEEDYDVIRETIRKEAPLDVDGTSLSSVLFVPGLLSKIRWFQANRGQDFLRQKKGSLTYNLFDRLRINFSKGLATETVGSRRSMIIDHEKVYYKYKGKRYKHMMDIPGIAGLVNRMDGGTFVSTDLLNKTGDELGAYPIFENEHGIKQLKTIEVHLEIDANGNYVGYIEKKHAEFEGMDGLEIFEKGTDKPLVKMVKEAAYNNEVVLYDMTSPGDFLDTVSDLDATKSLGGEYNIQERGESFGVFTLPESSRRVIISPKNKANETASGFGQYLYSLDYNLKGKEQQALKQYTNTILGILTDNASNYYQVFAQSATNPDRLWDLVKHKFSKEAEMKTSLRSKLSISDGAGLYHEDVLNEIVPQLLNSLIKNGVLKGRTLDKKIAEKFYVEDEYNEMTVGSHYIFSPSDEVREDSVILSADSLPLFNEVKRQSGLETVEEINEWLEDNDIWVLSYRFPILRIAALEPRKIQSFKEGGGQGVWQHPNDTFGKDTGDYDIDSSDVIILKQDQADVMLSFQKTRFYQRKRKMVNDINIYESLDPPHILSSKGTKGAMVDLLHGTHAQGQATNLQAVAGAMSNRVGKIEFSDGTIVRPKKLDDEVIQDYIPLKLTENQFNKEFADNEDMSIVKKGKKRYLKTTVDYELSQVTNMAVDNVKTGRLVNVAGARSGEWYTERLFHVESGELTPKHLRMLKPIVDEFKYSRLRKMITSDNQHMTIEDLKDELRIIRDKINDPDRFKGELLAKIKAGSYAIEEIENNMPKTVYKELAIKNIAIKSAQTPQETFLLHTLEYHEQLLGSMPGLEHSFDKINTYKPRKASHFAAANELFRETLTTYSFSLDAEKAIAAWSQKFNDDYYGVLKVLSQQARGNDLVDIQAEYSRELQDVVVEGKRKLLYLDKKYGEGSAQLATAIMLRGVNTTYRKNIPDPNMLDSYAYKRYKQLWDKYFNDYDSKGNHVIAATATKHFETQMTAAKLLSWAKNRKNC